MNTTLQPGGRSIEEFIGESTTGKLDEALNLAIKAAARTLHSDNLRWQLLYLSGVTTGEDRGKLVVTIKAKVASDE